MLTHPVIIPILLSIGLIGLVVEVLIPGVILPGVIGIASFAVFFIGQILAGYSGWEPILLFLLGIVLLVIEIFVTSFGILSVAGIASIGGSVAFAVADAKYGVQSFFLALILAGVATWITVKRFRNRGVWNKLILKQQLTKEEGYLPTKSYEFLLHREGTALTPLRPAGKVVIDGERFDVVTEGGFVEKGDSVVVIHVEGVRIVVRPASRQEGAAAPSV
ncbi:NfeD family protein [Effusibacillus dendaii]|uniref:NfeD-like C-terminal domain-containing protein n=1 Tax=Effusibacillus dendaii TaxID=2743772 RepID=A0A7I8DBK6_9BACL|nr:NfeD family protein [Effusibacillus dendaii]BCJ86226.1 hypothetical protein skT53_12110 [Effusibacillus dendaii]